jgi:hypothetical protein
VSGVAGLQKGISSINRLRGEIKALPLRIRSAVAKDAAAILDRRMRDSFTAGETVYGTPRPVSVKGTPLKLVKSGKTQNALHFVSVGTIVRAQLATPYAKYLVGKYQVMPQSSIPAEWRPDIEQVVREYRDDWARENGGSS